MVVWDSTVCQQYPLNSLWGGQGSNQECKGIPLNEMMELTIEPSRPPLQNPSSTSAIPENDVLRRICWVNTTFNHVYQFTHGLLSMNIVIDINEMAKY
ncbi:hypothetical protein L208DRAFT_82946 [Tricholoma matsutake]|nr:hypothetical protein L208DRAFT_82946 [Tricholoma matsutake 945]